MTDTLYKRSVVRTRQPQIPVRVARSSPLSRGLVVAAHCIGGSIPVNALNTGLYTQTSGAAGAGIAGKFADRTGAGSIVTPYAVADASAIVDFTLFMYIRVKSAVLEVLFSGSTSNAGLWIGVNPNGDYQVNRSSALATVAIDTTKPQKVFIRRTGTLCEFYVDGQWGTNTDTQAGTFSAVSTFAISNFGSAGAYPVPCDLYDVKFWDRALSNSELKSLTDNPWQLYAPEVRTYSIGDPAASGSAIKTFDGLVYASTKTVDGLALASVKTFNGLA